MINNEIIFYINISLFLIIIFNIILFTLNTSVETFNVNNINKSINAELRSCNIYLLDDEKMCDKLEKIYKMSNTQIDITLDKLKEKNKESYKLLKYVKSNKEKLDVNACKIQFSHLKEIVSDNYKNISKALNYDDNNLSGYCLSKLDNVSDIDDTISKIEITDSISKQINTYETIKISNDIKKVLETSKVCSYIKHTLDNNLKFFKLYCKLITINNKYAISVNKIELLVYINNKFIVYETDYDMNDFFKFTYNTKQILYQPKEITVSIYSFIFDACNIIDEFYIINFINFSLKEFNIPSKIVLYNVNLLPYTLDDNTNISSVLNKKINDSLDEITVLNNQIKVYNDNIKDIMNNYNEIQKYCNNNVDKPEIYDKCKKNMTSLLDKNDIIEEEKKFLLDKKEKEENNYTYLIEGQKKLRNISYSLNEINDIIKTGIILDYNKYSDYLSNDDCIYIQFS